MKDWSKVQHQDALRGEIARLRETLRIAEQERDGLRTELTQCRWDARHVAGCADTKTWEADNRVDYVQKRFHAELETVREAHRIAERERDEARTTNQRLNRRCGDYERALAEKRSLCSDGKPRGSAFSRAMLNAYLTEVLAYVEKVDAEVDELGELAWRWCIEARRGQELAILRAKFAAGEPLPCDEEGGVEMDTATGTLVVRPGDVLEGTEGDVTTRIRVTYVSEETLLAQHLWSRRSDGSEVDGPRLESTWTLGCRDWRKVEDSSTRSDDHED